MKRFRPTVVAATVAASLAMTGCYGKFALTKKLYNFNGSIGNKFAAQVVFWAFVIVPVYEVCAFVDTVVFNLIEFWSGGNPIAMKDGETQERVVEADGQRVKLTFSDRGQTVRIDGAGKSYVLRVEDSGATLRTADGQLVVESRATAAGGVEVWDANGVVMAKASDSDLAALAGAARAGRVAFEEQWALTRGTRVAVAR